MRGLYLLAVVPMVLAVAAIAGFVAWQARETSQHETAALESALIEAKRAELKNYLSMARTAIGIVYGNTRPDDARAKREASCTIPDDHIDPRRSALFMARSILREVREELGAC